MIDPARPGPINRIPVMSLQVSNASRLVAGALASPLKNFACVAHRSSIYVFGGLDSKERASAELQVRVVMATIISVTIFSNAVS